jgi:hypothetical protein
MHSPSFGLAARTSAMRVAATLGVEWMTPTCAAAVASNCSVVAYYPPVRLVFSLPSRRLLHRRQLDQDRKRMRNRSVTTRRFLEMNDLGMWPVDVDLRAVLAVAGNMGRREA